MLALLVAAALAPCPGCGLLASRGALVDLRARIESLRSENDALRSETRSLYGRWEGLASSVVPSERGREPALWKARTDDQRGALWRLFSKGERTGRRIEKALKSLERAERDWYAVRAALAASQKEAALKGAEEELARIKKRLSSVSEEVNALNDLVREGEEDYDALQPHLDIFLIREFPDAGVSASEPAHRAWARAQAERPELRYEFEEAYAAHLEQAARELR